MIPLRDINPTRRFPIATLALIVANVLVFAYQSTLGENQMTAFVNQFGVRPAILLRDLDGQASTLITSMFLHGDILHIGSNMLYLWIFGNNIEDRLGIVRFLLFYFITGLIASGTQIAIDPASRVPMIGASGAIAGVLGGYIVLFPNARVQTIIFLFYFIRIVEVSAVALLGWWFLLQVLNGALSLGIEAAEGGVAFFAHIGGFAAGWLLIRIFAIRPSSYFDAPEAPVDSLFRRTSNNPWDRRSIDDGSQLRRRQRRDDDWF